MNKKTANKLSKYAIELTTPKQRQKLKDFIESKGLDLYMYNSLDWDFLGYDTNCNKFCANHEIYTRVPISIDKFIRKFSKPSCKQKLKEAEVKLSKYELKKYTIRLTVQEEHSKRLRTGAIFTQAELLTMLIESVKLDLGCTWEADWTDDTQSKWNVYYQHNEKLYYNTQYFSYQVVGTAYCSEKIAERVVQVLNDGLFKL